MHRKAEAEAEAGVEEATARGLDGDEMTNIQGPNGGARRGASVPGSQGVLQPCTEIEQSSHILRRCDELLLITRCREQVQVYIQNWT
jgi:hypothetical protein